MKNRFPLLLLVACAALLVVGLLQLFKVRFEAGDVYPEYSSLRSDPLGTMALYESLNQLRGINVDRDISTITWMPDGRDTTYLHLAASATDWHEIPADTFSEIQKFLASGGRLVITLFPVPGDRADWIDDGDSVFAPQGKTNQAPRNVTPGNNPAKKKLPRNDRDEMFARKPVSLGERWGLDFGGIKLKANADGAYEPVIATRRADLPIPASLDWHSGVVLTNLSTAWNIVYARGTNAVVAERSVGRGTVVVATDSYFLSNEAMLRDRHSDLLSWLVGPNHNAIFDEAHLGVTEGSGVAVLIRKYRLHGFVAALLLLAALFIWKNSATLVPRAPDAPAEDSVPGRDAAAGFVNLLRRSVPPRELLATCFDEWKKSAPLIARCSPARREQAEMVFESENALEARDRDPIRAYQAICRTLKS